MEDQGNVSTTGDQANGTANQRRVAAADIQSSSVGIDLALDVVSEAIGAFFDALT